jgi:hypothetical protein
MQIKKFYLIYNLFTKCLLCFCLSINKLKILWNEWKMKIQKIFLCIKFSLDPDPTRTRWIRHLRTRTRTRWIRHLRTRTRSGPGRVLGPGRPDGLYWDLCRNVIMSAERRQELNTTYPLVYQVVILQNRDYDEHWTVAIILLAKFIAHSNQWKMNEFRVKLILKMNRWPHSTRCKNGIFTPIFALSQWKLIRSTWSSWNR